MSGQLHTSAALPQGKEPSAHMAPEPIEDVKCAEWSCLLYSSESGDRAVVELWLLGKNKKLVETRPPVPR
jgi:hypothetical protein